MSLKYKNTTYYRNLRKLNNYYYKKNVKKNIVPENIANTDETASDIATATDNAAESTGDTATADTANTASDFAIAIDDDDGMNDDEDIGVDDDEINSSSSGT